MVVITPTQIRLNVFYVTLFEPPLLGGYTVIMAESFSDRIAATCQLLRSSLDLLSPRLPLGH